MCLELRAAEHRYCDRTVLSRTVVGEQIDVSSGSVFVMGLVMLVISHAVLSHSLLFTDCYAQNLLCMTHLDFTGPRQLYTGDHDRDSSIPVHDRLVPSGKYISVTKRSFLVPCAADSTAACAHGTASC